MEQKTKVLIGVITDQEIGCRNQEDYIEELAENIAERDDIIRGLRQEKITSSEAYHEAMVSKDAENALLKGESESHKELKNCIMEFTNHYHDGLKSDNPTDEQLIEGYKRANEEHNKHKAKSSKLTAEKRKLMELIREEVKGGYTGTIRVLDNYKAWQRAQRKPGK